MVFLYILLALIILICTWLFLISPGDDSGMEKYKNVKYAHRGLHGTVGYDEFAAENSLTAFKRAKEHGFGIELDVRATKDGEVVVFHDGTLERVTGSEGKVEDFTLEELQRLKLSGTEDTIPTLKEVLDLIDGAIPLLIELKEEGLDHTISEKTAEALKEYKGDYIVESFNPFAFGAFKKQLPKVSRGFLACKHTSKETHRSFKYRLIQRFFFNFLARPAFIAMHVKTPKLFPMPLIAFIFKTPMIAWTVKSKEEEIEAYKNGFSGIIFEGYMPD
ncbi:MAG: glycerophosphodiester phosphodiesterase [Ruminococcaceae bacterium]|nr:glycerophosphodiester phosphodiesterase [Oscillospiraceae bacterium]